MAKSPAMTKALRDARRWQWLAQEDRAHLDRWMEVASDRVWDNLADAITAFGVFSEAEALSNVVWVALKDRREAEKYGKFDPKQKLKTDKKTRGQLQALAEKMEDVVANYLACRAAHETGRRPPPPDADGTYEDPTVGARKRSLAWLEKDAQRLRELAAIPSISDSRISRQRRGQKRSNSREISIFVREMAGFMGEATGKPRWSTVAALTNVAFPSAEADAENVRIMCRERRKKPVHSNAKSAKKGR
jgi:hypothetical protein